jgi:hypothetical protein
MRILLTLALAVALLIPSGFVGHAEDGLIFTDSGLEDPPTCDASCSLGNVVEAFVNTWEHVIDTLSAPSKFDEPAVGTGTAIRN